LLELIAKDQSLACDVANNLSTIQENVDVDINAIVKVLERLGNHEVDTNLANNSSFKRTVSKLTTHPDPITASIAEGTLS
jgi:sensor domain CHASE-containing protein